MILVKWHFQGSLVRQGRIVSDVLLVAKDKIPVRGLSIPSLT